MADGPRAVTDERLRLARSLLGHLEAGNEQSAAAVIAELAGQRDDVLFQEVVRLTRALQDSLSSFVQDERLIDLAETEVPDAAERLRYVIAATEEAANTTLGAVEDSLPLADALRREARHLAGQWDSFQSRQPSVEDLRELSSELSNFLLMAQASSEALHEKLSDVLLAQGYQDLTGQVIRKVIALVNDVMVSALTSEGARSTLEALDAGAVDFLAKQGGFQGSGTDGHHLSDRVISIVRRRRVQQAPAYDAVVQREGTPRTGAPGQQRSAPPRLIVIGASTGGAVAVQRVLTALPADYRYPVLVAVHMPGEFTPTFAERLDSLCRVDVRHASDGDPLLPGRVLIAPGGMQTRVESHGSRLRVRVEPAGGQLYKPSIDVLFESAARVLDRAVQAVVLTGMGSDGALGARTLKERGSSVWTQDQASSVVFGMPYAVAKAGCSDRVIALDDMGAALTGLA